MCIPFIFCIMSPVLTFCEGIKIIRAESILLSVLFVGLLFMATPSTLQGAERTFKVHSVWEIERLIIGMRELTPEAGMTFVVAMITTGEPGITTDSIKYDESGVPIGLKFFAKNEFVLDTNEVALKFKAAEPRPPVAAVRTVCFVANHGKDKAATQIISEVVLSLFSPVNGEDGKEKSLESRLTLNSRISPIFVFEIPNKQIALQRFTVGKTELGPLQSKGKCNSLSIKLMSR